MTDNLRLTPEQRKIVIALAEEKRTRMRKIKTHEDNELAVQDYNNRLIRLLKRLDPSKFRWL